MASDTALSGALDDAPAATERYPVRITGALRPWVERRARLLEWALYAVAALMALVFRTVQDDAFISFRYARNLSEGHGLVFNPGERVEGYTNFLWTVILWVPEHFGWSTPGFSIVLTVPLMVGTVALALRLARRVFEDEALALLAAAVLVANMSFVGYGTTGLETMLQALLVTAVAVALVPRAGDVTARARMAAGVCGALAILTRLDSAVLVLGWVAVHLWWMARTRGERPAVLAAAAARIAAPAAVLLVPWFVWKVGYYDSVVPNTLEAKSWSNSWEPFLVGLLYLLVFFASYAAFVFIGRAVRLRGRFPARHAKHALIVVVAAWFLYVAVVGADFMEFRFMVPVIPVLALYAAWLVDHVRSRIRTVALVGVLCVVSLVHVVIGPAFIYPVLTFAELKHWPDDGANSWQRFGEMLHDEFPGGVDAPGQPVLGIVPAGVVPYYSQLPSIDMLGLNDAWTAKHGMQYPFYFPGHVRTSTVDYLERRNVSLLLGSMREDEVVPGRRSYRLSEIADLQPGGNLRELPSSAKVLEIPTGTEGRAWQFVYLRQNDKVDAAIERNGWKLYPIDRKCKAADLVDPGVGGILLDIAKAFAERTCPDL